MLCQRFSSFYSVKGLWRERDKYFRWKTESLSKITSSGLRGLSDRTWDISVRIIVNYFGIWISTRDLWDDSIKNISPGPVLKLTEYFSIWTNVTDVHSEHKLVDFFVDIESVQWSINTLYMFDKSESHLMNVSFMLYHKCFNTYLRILNESV